MIQLRNVVKHYKANGRKFAILNGISADFMPGVNVGILGQPGSGKTTLMNIIGGAIMPDSGSVTRAGRATWPTIFTSCFSKQLSGRKNLLFPCHLYGLNTKKITQFVENFSGLGDQLDQPLKTYDLAMRARLAFSLSMAIGHDFYLFDTLEFKGRRSLRIELNKIFAQCKAAATLLIASDDAAAISEHCDVAGVLHQGRLMFFNKISEAVEYYEALGKIQTETGSGVQ